jgi:Calcineurin-like phosphoesterase
MKLEISRRQLLVLLASFPAWYAFNAFAQSKRGGQGRGGKQKRADYNLPIDLAEFAGLSLVLGRVSNNSVTISALSREGHEAYFEYGAKAGSYTRKTDVASLAAGEPVETVLGGLKPNTQYFYRLRYRKPGEATFAARAEKSFHTQRTAGSSFTFGIQGDSHPERAFMSDPNLYARTLQNAAAIPPDFYICMGDDFSISTLQTIDAESVTGRYTLQRPFLGLIGQTAPIFLLNGNHEQASLFNYDQTDDRHQAAVLAQSARNKYFPTIAPDGFYTGNTKSLDEIGPLKDYYAWTWGDALFVVLDNYWHSKEQVDSGLHGKSGGKGAGGGGGKQKRDLWGVTLGEEQYQWFKKTLESSRAKYKFVFAHHVLGTQRGGVDVAHLYEWGGHDKNGEHRFKEMRPGWELPIHDLMVKNGVTIFFQGHDHLFCKQEKDGVIYQEVPMPADQGYVAYNEDRYESGVKLPNSGHLRVTVSPDDVKVDYVRCYLTADETADKKTGQIAHSYSVKAK